MTHQYSQRFGAVQRWLLVNLPRSSPWTTKHPKVSARDLAASYFATDEPTVDQVASVRRALRILEKLGYARRWAPSPVRRGAPSLWTLNDDR